MSANRGLHAHASTSAACEGDGVIYLSGHSGSRLREVAMKYGIGLMVQPGNGYLRQLAYYPHFAADNGCYAKGDAFKVEEYLCWLAGVRPYQGKCLFAVAPDVVGDAKATWERARRILPVLRAMGFKAALVAQDGIECMSIPWQAFDVLFIGGTTEWKCGLHAFQVAQEAVQREVWVHVGRVNSARRMDMARRMGASSCDGTYLAKGPDVNLRSVINWQIAASQQRMMELTA